MTLRQVNRKDAAAELEIMRDIFNDAWSENWGFVPFTDPEFDHLAAALKQLIDEDLTVVAECDGEVMGCAFRDGNKPCRLPNHAHFSGRELRSLELASLS